MQLSHTALHGAPALAPKQHTCSSWYTMRCLATAFLPSKAELTIVTLQQEVGGGAAMQELQNMGREPGLRHEPGLRLVGKACVTDHASSPATVAQGRSSKPPGAICAALRKAGWPAHIITPCQTCDCSHVKCVSASGAPVGLPLWPACLCESFWMARLTG